MVVAIIWCAFSSPSRFTISAAMRWKNGMTSMIMDAVAPGNADPPKEYTSCEMTVLEKIEKKHPYKFRCAQSAHMCAIQKEWKNKITREYRGRIINSRHEEHGDSHASKPSKHRSSRENDKAITDTIQDIEQQPKQNSRHRLQRRQNTGLEGLGRSILCRCVKQMYGLFGR